MQPNHQVYGEYRAYGITSLPQLIIVFFRVEIGYFILDLYRKNHYYF